MTGIYETCAPCLPLSKDLNNLICISTHNQTYWTMLVDELNSYEQGRSLTRVCNLIRTQVGVFIFANILRVI